MILNKGQIIAGRYEIAEKLGAGGMAVVYLAKDQKLDRFVTCKVLREEHLTNDEFIRRFMVEARAVASLNHANIVNVYDVGQEGQIHYIVMEYIDGVTLKDLIDRKAPFDDVEALGVSIQIASALSHAHKSGIVHRDIKPHNILVTSSGAVKVTDFGIAQSIHARMEPLNGSTLGSIHYFSPEQARGGYVDHKSDLYSLGIVMFEMITGALPFDGEESVDVALMHVNDPLPDMLALNPDISKSMESIILCLTQKDADARYGSADKLLIDMRTAMTKPNLVLGFGEESDGANQRAGGSFWVRYKVELAAVATALLIIVLGFLIAWPLLTGGGSDRTKVPQFIGLSIEDATALAAKSNLIIEKQGERFDETAAFGTILDQGYDKGDPVKKGETIGVVVSLGTYKNAIPDLTNIELSAAKAKLVDYDFKLEVLEEPSNNTPAKIIIRQSPSANEPAAPGTTITVVVSTGFEQTTVAVPHLVGLKETAAKSKLMEAGLVIGSIDRDYSTLYAQDIVIAQTIEGGREVSTGTIVGFVTSFGPAPATPHPIESERPDETERPTATVQPNETEQPNDPTPATPSATPNNSNVEKSYSLQMWPNIAEDVESFEVIVMKKTSDSIVEIYRAEHLSYDLPIIISVQGTGKAEYIMVVDGVNIGSQVVDFDSL